MIKIFHFITDTNIGGAGRLLCNQIKNMVGSDFDITVVLPRGSRLIEPLSSLPCKLIEVNNGADRSFSAKSFFEDIEILKENRPDIVHSHASLSSRLASTALGIPTRIHTRHCVFPISKIMKNPISRAVVGTANNLFSTAMLAVADSAKQNLVDMGCSEKKITTIINGVDPLRAVSEAEKSALREKLSLHDGDFVISIFARLEACKGHKTFLEGAKVCHRYYPNFRFLIVGDGSEADVLKIYAKELGIDSAVHFTGFSDDVAPLYSITDINVNCSCGTETSSLALSEGMSLGIPAVASDYGGNPHMVKNCENGLLFPVKNAEALAMALIRLYRDKELYSACSRGALERYKNEFTARKMSEKMMDFYRLEYEKSQKRKK